MFELVPLLHLLLNWFKLILGVSFILGLGQIKASFGTSTQKIPNPCKSSSRSKTNFFRQVLAVFLVDLSGVLLHLNERDFYAKFDYPLNGDIRKYMEQLRLGRELEQVGSLFLSGAIGQRPSNYLSSDCCSSSCSPFGSFPHLKIIPFKFLGLLRV